MATIYLKNVGKRYEKNIVFNDLNLTVRHGECFTLLGPSGCGKTVLLRLIAGFETPDEGSVHIGEILVADSRGESVPPDRRDLGVVFQEYAVWPHMTVFDNVAYPLKLAKVPAGELRERAMRAVDLVNMTGLEKRLPSELSGGQQQRVALARALVANPSLMLLDEPLSNLDANLREEMRFEIRELQRKLDITVFYVTHDQEIALAISDRIAIMDRHGRVRQVGTPVEIYERPADLFVFNFMGVANFMAVRREADGWYVGEGRQRVPGNGPKGLSGEDAEDAKTGLVAGFRPSDVVISRPDASTDSVGGASGGISGGVGPKLRGVVKRASFLGAMMDYLVEIDGTRLRTEVETHQAMRHGLMFAEGEECDVSFHTLHWFDAAELSEVAG